MLAEAETTRPPTLRIVAERPRGSVRHFPRESIVDDTGPERTTFSVLESGWAGLERSLKDGRRQLLHIYLPGDIIGVHRLVASGDIYRVTALSDVRLGSMTLSGDPGGGNRIVAQVLALQERLMRHLTRTGRLTALERTADCLVDLHERQVASGRAKDGLMPFPITQSMLSDYLGLSTVHINRCLQTLRRERLVVLSGGQATLSDIEALRSLAGTA